MSSIRFILSFENLGIEDDKVDDELAQITNELFVSDAIVALAAEKKSPETFNLIKITKEYDTKDYDDTDD